MSTVQTKVAARVAAIKTQLQGDDTKVKIKHGDTLSVFAQALGVTPGEVQEKLGLPTSVIKAGEELNLSAFKLDKAPLPGPSGPPATAQTTGVSGPTSAANGPQTITVSPQLASVIRGADATLQTVLSAPEDFAKAYEPYRQGLVGTVDQVNGFLGAQLPKVEKAINGTPVAIRDTVVDAGSRAVTSTSEALRSGSHEAELKIKGAGNAALNVAKAVLEPNELDKAVSEKVMPFVDRLRNFETGAIDTVKAGYTKTAKAVGGAYYWVTGIRFQSPIYNATSLPTEK